MFFPNKYKNANGVLYTSPQINTNKKGRENCSRIEIK
jgi:hypothetical protein